MERSVLVRRTAPVAVFAAVLAVLVAVMALAGGGGGGDARGTREPRVLPLAMGFRAQGEGAPRDAAASTSLAYYGGEIVIPDRLLTGVPTEGPVYNVRPGDTATARIAALAKALGVSGDVRSDAEGWVVGDGDAVLRVMRQPGSPWYLGMDKVAVATDSSSSSGGGSVGVATAAPATTEPKPDPSGPDTPVSNEPTCKATPEGEVCAEPAPADCPPPPDGTEPACEVPAPRPVPEESKPPQPSDDEARAVAQRVFDALGITGAKITFNDAWSAKEVVAAPVVGGLPTMGFETRVSVDDAGTITYANGFLGTAEVDATYPLLAPREAVERGDGAYGRPVMDIAIAPCPPNEPCPTPRPREATALRLGLTFMSSYDASQGAFLAPAWLLTFEGSTWEEPMLALPDRFIATPPPASDSPGTIEPGDPGGKPGEVPPDGGEVSSDMSGETAGGTAGGLEPGTAAPE